MLKMEMMKEVNHKDIQQKASTISQDLHDLSQRQSTPKKILYSIVNLPVLLPSWLARNHRPENEKSISTFNSIVFYCLKNIERHHLPKT